MSKMNEVVAKDAGGVESVNAIRAQYNERIARIRQMMEIRKKKKASTEDVAKIVYGIAADLNDETRLPPDEVKALEARAFKEGEGAEFELEGAKEFDRYGNDCIVALYVASQKSMRKVANEMGINVSTVSRHVKKWAAKNAELRGDLLTTREVELARLDEMLDQLDQTYMDSEKRYSTRLHILDRKYRLMGLYASAPQVVVGIGIQQGRQAGNQPRVIDDVARDITDDSA